MRATLAACACACVSVEWNLLDGDWKEPKLGSVLGSPNFERKVSRWGGRGSHKGGRND